MEVCERVLKLAVVSSVLSVATVLGKYVRGIVNTKEVSPTLTVYRYPSHMRAMFGRSVLQSRTPCALIVCMIA